jgi:hypothetical protein
MVKTRAPVAGRSFWLIMRIYSVNGHSEFYPSKDLPLIPRPYSYVVTLSDEDSVEIRRTIRVYEVDKSTATKLTEYREGVRVIPLNELQSPPCDDCAASDEIGLPFAQ